MDDRVIVPQPSIHPARGYSAIVVVVLVVESHTIILCISNATWREVGQASCLPIQALQAGRLHHTERPVCITYAEGYK
jgi:hypothetical protein